MNKILLILLLSLSSSVSAQLRLNEFSAHEGFSIEGETHDWLEVTNIGEDPILMSDYFLTDNADDLEKWQLPNYLIQPQEILLLVASGDDISDLGNHWESIVVADQMWRYILPDGSTPAAWNQPTFDDSSWNSAVGGFGYDDDDDNTIVPVGTPSVYQRITFEVEDLSPLVNLEIHADYDDGFVAYLNGEEVARSFNVEGNPPAYNQGTTMYQEASLTQGLLPEIYNIPLSALQSGTNTLAIHTLNVDANSSDLSSNYFLMTEVASSGLIYQNTPNWFEQPNGQSVFFQTNFKLKEGEILLISDQNGIIIDSHLIPEDLRFGLSKGRYPDGTGDWCYIDTPTPDESNAESWCYAGVAVPPEVSLPSGWYSGTQTVTTSSDDIVRYSLNGDYPQGTNPVFSGLSISENTSLSFRSFSSNNLLPSEVVDRTYIFSEDNHNLPVISIHSDEDGLFDYNSGIYEFGPNANLDDFPYFGSNFWESWSRFARLEYFNADKELQAEEHLDLKIHGGWSRAYSQRSFRLDFKNEYTGDFEVPVFDNKPWVNELNNVNVRNGGQHVWESKFQDGLLNDLANDLNLDNVAYEGCLLYINGEFWGVYGIREKVDRHYVKNNHGISEIDLLNRDGVLEGSADHFYQSLEAILAMDSNDPDFYGFVNTKFDLENYMDYFIVETYCQNMDWMGIAWGLNNVKLWRPQAENGRWRYVLYDTDAGFGHFWMNPWDDYIFAALNPDDETEHSDLFNKLLENDQFKCEFAQRYADIVNTVFTEENFNSKADELRDNLAAAMPLQSERWNESLDPQDWSDEVESIKNYNSSRIDFARTHVNDNLDLGGGFNITVTVSPEEAGHIQINSVIPESYPWTGLYFNGCPIEITAIPNEGYSFLNWLPNEEFSDIIESESILSNVIGNSEFTANFMDSSGVSGVSTETSITLRPNPTNGEFILEVTSAETEELEVEIFNSLGQLILFKDMNKLTRVMKERIDISSFNSGVFMVKVYSNNGVYSSKIVKE